MKGTRAPYPLPFVDAIQLFWPFRTFNFFFGNRFSKVLKFQNCFGNSKKWVLWKMSKNRPLLCDYWKSAVRSVIPLKKTWIKKKTRLARFASTKSWSRNVWRTSGPGASSGIRDSGIQIRFCISVSILLHIRGYYLFPDKETKSYRKHTQILQAS